MTDAGFVGVVVVDGAVQTALIGVVVTWPNSGHVLNHKAEDVTGEIPETPIFIVSHITDDVICQPHEKGGQGDDAGSKATDLTVRPFHFDLLLDGLGDARDELGAVVLSPLGLCGGGHSCGYGG